MPEPKKLSNEELAHLVVEMLGFLGDLSQIVSDAAEHGVHATHQGPRANDLVAKIRQTLLSVGIEPESKAQKPN